MLVLLGTIAGCSPTARATVDRDSTAPAAHSSPAAPSRSAHVRTFDPDSKPPPVHSAARARHRPAHSRTVDPDSHPPATHRVAGALPRPAHVLVVVMENKRKSQVIGSADAPYLNSLARAGATFPDSHGIGHPSQPNYIALLSGSTHGVTSDACPQDLGAKPNLARALLNARRSFASYSESMPQQGFTGCSGTGGLYARKHNPVTDFSNIPASSNRTYSQFPTNYGSLPTVSFLMPDLCHDMHDCSVATGDAWARAHLSDYVRWAAGHNSLLIITFDEDDWTDANTIPTIFVGPMVRPVVSGQRIDHYNVLRTLEDCYALGRIGLTAGVAPITGIWR